MMIPFFSARALGTARDSIPFYPVTMIVRKAETLSVWACRSTSALHIPWLNILAWYLLRRRLICEAFPFALTKVNSQPLGCVPADLTALYHVSSDHCCLSRRGGHDPDCASIRRRSVGSDEQHPGSFGPRLGPARSSPWRGHQDSCRGFPTNRLRFRWWKSLS